MKKRTYGMKLDSLIRGIDTTEKDLNFLCSLIESPDEEYNIPDAVEYAHAIVALSRQLNYMISEISENDLTEDEELVMLSKEQLVTLNALTNAVEDAVGRLRLCGISLKQN